MNTIKDYTKLSITELGAAMKYIHQKLWELDQDKVDTTQEATSQAKYYAVLAQLETEMERKLTIS